MLNGPKDHRSFAHGGGGFEEKSDEIRLISDDIT